MFIPIRIEPMFSYTFSDADGNIVDPSNMTSYNQTMLNAVKYRPAPAGITDIFGFFTWIVTGVKLILNIFMTPIFGVPQFMTNYLYVPAFITVGLGAMLTIVQLAGLYEFASGREIL
jgi:hypothetical protein